MATTARGLATMLAARVSISASRRSGSTTRFTSPRACACAASMNSPVTSISNAALRATLRDSGTLGVEQNSPEVNAADREPRGAGSYGQVALRGPAGSPRRWRYPVRARSPGTGRRRSVSIMRVHCANSPR